ncbi:Protein FAM221A/B [Phytophthora infestans]|uniref:Protein FAM221A n=1 Tax=Phytophthora infestans TaxID=4787 RepID=A0A833TEF8_PHYIN|nr:Protein FAM221A/B [Phytophthora infestans]
MEQDAASRAQSLQLLKSKLRRRRSKVNHCISATCEGLTSNQQEEGNYPTEPEMDARQIEQSHHALQVKRSSRDLFSGKVQDTKISCLDDTSTTQASCKQDEISVVELRQEFAELKGKAVLPIAHQPNELMTLAGTAPAPFPMKLKSYTKMVIQWSCDTCKRECIPVREESRCLCGHRYKEHPSSVSDPRVKSPKGFRAFACTSARCSCRAFFYVVAEGAWILRCRCKHRHTDHDPGSKPFVCKRPKCGCQGFDSPWVCNCDHPWGAHRQHLVEKKFDPLQMLQAQLTAPELNTVHRTDLLASPRNLRL